MHRRRALGASSPTYSMRKSGSWISISDSRRDRYVLSFGPQHFMTRAGLVFNVVFKATFNGNIMVVKLLLLEKNWICMAANNQSSYAWQLEKLHVNLQNHRWLDCLLRRLFGLTTRKQLRSSSQALCGTVTGGLPSHKADFTFPYDNVMLFWDDKQLILSVIHLK